MARIASQVVATLGHEVHLCRALEARRLLRWAGPLQGDRLLDLAGGDGYWASRAVAEGASAVCLDLDSDKLRRGATYRHAPAAVRGDALALPFPGGAFDVVLSVCAIEHFESGERAVAEMARVLAPAGRLLLSADSLTDRREWPQLFEVHARKYQVHRTYDLEALAALFERHGLVIRRHHYLFRSVRAQRLYLSVSARGGRIGWNALAPAAAWVAASDARQPNERGSVLLVEAVTAPA